MGKISLKTHMADTYSQAAQNQAKFTFV